MAKTRVLPILAIIATIALVATMCGLCEAQPQEANEYYYGSRHNGRHEGRPSHPYFWEILMSNPFGSTAEPPGVLQTINFDDSTLYPLDDIIDEQTIEGFIWQATNTAFPTTAATNIDNQCAIGGVITTTPTPLTNGYINGIVSQNASLIINQDGDTAAAYVCASNGAGAGKAFIPQSIQATAAWRDNMTLTVTGYDASGAAGRTLTATIDYAGPTSIDLTSLGQIYSMSLASSGGVDACYDFPGDEGRQFALDDFVVRRDIGPEVAVTCTPPFTSGRSPSDATPSPSDPWFKPVTQHP